MNNAALATTTHRKPKRMSNGTGTQVRAQMINKCGIKIAQSGLYNERDPPSSEEEKEKGKRHSSNLEPDL